MSKKVHWKLRKKFLSQSQNKKTKKTKPHKLKICIWGIKKINFEVDAIVNLKGVGT